MINVGILLGGQSPEHQVSLMSAKNVIEAIDKTKYQVFPIGIDQQGSWYSLPSVNYLINPDDPQTIKLNIAGDPLTIAPGTSNPIGGLQLDVIFPVLHGANGEDGTIQGLLQLLTIPFVGAGVLGSAVGLDKDVMKRLLQQAGLPVGQFAVIRLHQSYNQANITQTLGLPLFVKPANTGSSVGVVKVKNESKLESAIAQAFKHDSKVLIEAAIVGREIECSVLGNDQPIASAPGEIVLHSDFYSYEAKYIDETAATPTVPADLSPQTIETIQALAIKTFQTLDCRGLARVDFFLQPDGQIFINEINTIPGFTKISMYPKMWAASGISYPELIDRLLNLALENETAS